MADCTLISIAIEIATGGLYMWLISLICPQLVPCNVERLHFVPPNMTSVPSQVRAIVVVPSQELAAQVHSVFELMCRRTVLSVGVVGGRVSLETEQALLQDWGAFPPCSKVDVLIATPGRLVEHLDRWVCPCGSGCVCVVSGVCPMVVECVHAVVGVFVVVGVSM